MTEILVPTLEKALASQQSRPVKKEGPDNQDEMLCELEPIK